MNVITKFKEVSSLYVFIDHYQMSSNFDINKSLINLQEFFIYVKTCNSLNLWGSFYDYDKDYNNTSFKKNMFLV